MGKNEELFKKGDFETLYLNNIGFMKKVAGKFATKYCSNSGLEFDDCMGCGDVAFARALQGFDSERSKWLTYFSKVMINEILMAHRKLNKDIVSLDDYIASTKSDSTIVYEDLLASDEDIEEKIINKTMLDEILTMAESLSESDRYVFTSIVNGVTQCEISKQLKISQPTVSKIKRRVYQDLRNAYNSENIN